MRLFEYSKTEKGAAHLFDGLIKDLNALGIPDGEKVLEYSLDDDTPLQTFEQIVYLAVKNLPYKKYSDEENNSLKSDIISFKSKNKIFNSVCIRFELLAKALGKK